MLITCFILLVIIISLHLLCHRTHTTIEYEIYSGAIVSLQTIKAHFNEQLLPVSGYIKIWCDQYVETTAERL